MLQIQSAALLAAQAVTYELKVRRRRNRPFRFVVIPSLLQFELRTKEGKEVDRDIIETDLNRQIVKADSCVITVSFGFVPKLQSWLTIVKLAQIPEIEFEIPASGKSDINTIEGILSHVAEDLQESQGDREVASLFPFLPRLFC